MTSQEIMLDIAEKFGFDSFDMVCECIGDWGWGGVGWGLLLKMVQWCNRAYIRFS